MLKIQILPVPSMTMRGCLVLVLCVLSACGGNSGAEIETDPTLTGPNTIPTNNDPNAVDDTALHVAADRLLDVWAPNGVPNYTPLSATQAFGSASYEGYLYGDISVNSGAATDSLIGELSIEVGFGSTETTFTGSAVNFRDGRDNALAGTLTISDGDLDRSGNPTSDATIRDMQVSGTLTAKDGSRLTMDVALEGDFLGSTAQAIGGEAIGGVTVDGTDQNFDGGFIAAQ